MNHFQSGSARLRVKMAMDRHYKTFHLLYFAFAFAFAFALCHYSAKGSAVFNVVEFGAMADGRTDDSRSFHAAWNAACSWRGKARFVVPNGTFAVGPLTFNGPCISSPIVVRLMGVVKAHHHLTTFKPDGWIVFRSLQGLVVTGGGTVDGQGASSWPHNYCHHDAQCKLPPTSLQFVSVTDANVRRITSVNSNAFHISIYNCQNFEMQHLHISAPEDSPNTDGIHVSNSKGIMISSSVIGTGDDCISIGPGSSNVSIFKVLCGPGHGISVGSLGRHGGEEDVTALKIQRCKLSGTTNGLRIKTWPGSPVSLASDFIFEDVVMRHVSNPIIIDQQYCPVGSCTNQPSHVKIRDVMFKDIRGTSASKVAVNLLCSRDQPCENVRLININLKYQEDSNASTSCSNVKGVYAGIQIPPPCL